MRLSGTGPGPGTVTGERQTQIEFTLVAQSKDLADEMIEFFGTLPALALPHAPASPVEPPLETPPISQGPAQHHGTKVQATWSN